MQPKFTIVISVIAAFLCRSAAYIEGPEREENSLIPKALVPTEYSLTFDMTMADKRYLLLGSTKIRLTCMISTNEIILNMKDFFLAKNPETDRENVRVIKELPNSEFEPLNISQPKLEAKKEWLIIGLEKELQKDEKIQILLYYYKNINTWSDPDVAIIKYSYIRKINDELKWVVVSIPGAVNARRLYPCIDEPAVKANVGVNILSDEYLTLSNTRVIEKEIRWNEPGNPDNLDKFTSELYHSTPSLSPFSIGFVVGNLVTKPKSDDSLLVDIRIWSDEDVIKQMDFASETAENVVEFYREFFNSIHEVYKVDVVALPFYGHTNKWNYGLITLEESLIINENPSTQVRKIETTFTLCDIFCHQYFGPQITFKTWSENWLNMGLALFYRLPCLEEIFPNEETSIANIHLVESFIRVLSVDAELKSRPVMVPDSRIDLTHLFQDTILAETAHFLVRMISYFLGEDTLSEQVKNHYSEFKFQVTSLEELWKKFTLGENNRKLLPEVTFTDIMNSWTLKEGFAHIKMTRNKEGKFVTIQQELPVGSDGINTRIIPLNFITNSKSKSITMENAHKEEQVQYWLQSEPITIPIEMNDWIVLNSRLNVLCRVEYDPITLELLRKTLMNKNTYDMIDVMARTQFISDLFASAEMGNLSNVTLLNFMGYLKHEKSPLPITVALHELNRMRMGLFGTEIFSLFHVYFQYILRAIIRNNKFNIRKISEDYYEQYYFQKLIFTSACTFRLEICVEESVAYFKQLRKDGSLSDENYPIPAALRESFYCQAIKEGNDEDWYHLIFFYTSERWDHSNDIILNALACTTDGRRITNYLHYILEPERIAPRDRLTVFKSVASNEKGYSLMRSFLRNNDDLILAVYGNDLSKVYPYLQILYENTWKQEDFNELEDFKAFNVPPEDIEIHLTDSKRIAKKNILWLKNMEVEILNFFEENQMSRP